MVIMCRFGRWFKKEDWTSKARNDTHRGWNSIKP